MELHPSTNHCSTKHPLPGGNIEIKHHKIDKVLSKLEKPQCQKNMPPAYHNEEEEEKEENDEVDYEDLTKQYVERCRQKGLQLEDATNMQTFLQNFGLLTD